MGILEIILQKLEKMEVDLQKIKQSDPEINTSMISTDVMAQELDMNMNSFRNIMMPKLVNMKVIKKIGGRYKARRCDFEQFKKQGYAGRN